MIRLRSLLVYCGLITVLACAPRKAKTPPSARNILYALPDQLPEKYDYRLQGVQVTAVAWLAGSFKGDGRLQLPHRETVELRARQRADLEHHLLITEASVDEGNRLLHTRVAMKRAANQLRDALAGMPQIRAVHLDFEYNGPGLAEAYVEFVHTLRKAMPQPVSLYVTAFPSVGMPQKWSAFYLPEQLAYFADGVVFMLYDLHRNGTAAGCVSPISWLDANVAEFSKLPPEKIWLGAPLYGYQFTGKKARVLSKKAFEKLPAKETEVEGCRVKSFDDSKAYYPAESLYAHYLKLASEHGFAGVTYWRAGLEK
jgi:spore germination protein YaaH